MGRPSPIPFPLSSFPGANPQEGAGRLINCYAEPLGEPSKPSAPAQQVWRGSSGLSQHAITAENNYRGGLIVKNLSYEVFQSNVVTVDVAGNVAVLGNMLGTKKVSIARDQAATPDVLAVDVDNGAYILNTAALANASIAATIAGGAFVAADTVNLQFVNTGIAGFPVTVTYTLGAGETATTVAAGLKALINANAQLAGVAVTATNVAGVLTIVQGGAIGNATSLTSVKTGTGTETVTFNPATGFMAGGTGTVGIVFAGAPLAYNGLGNLPQPNSVSNQDGYFFLTIGDGRVFATGINNLTLNALTYITIQSKADVTLLRGIPFSGIMLFFTTGHYEAWQDPGTNPAPNFPYSRLTIGEKGLVQFSAIAGFETGFSELLWVDQAYTVQWLTAGSLAPVEVSPPDLNRLIETQVRAGNLIEAGCYSEGGKKFWVISSPAWSWEFNIATKRWNERWSLKNGVYGRWRATCGHPAFNRWIVGDQQSGNLLFHDLTNFTENGAFQLFRIESGPVRDFPQAQRIARADFDFVFGTATAVGNYQMIVLGAAAGSGGVVRLTVNQTAQAKTGDEAQVEGVTGTTEANGTFPMTVVDTTHIELQGTVFANAYISGGVVTDITAPVGAINPNCAISCSKNGGQSFDTPSIRSLAPQGKVKRSRASVKNRGQAGAAGTRWRIDITDPVYRGFLGATTSSDPREVAP